MIPIKTIIIEQVRRDISSVKQAFVKFACNRVISPGISHIACELVETAIRTFMFGCLFSIFHHAIKNVSLIQNTDQTFSLYLGEKDKQKFHSLWQISHVFRSSEFHFISSYSPVSQKNNFY